VQPPTVAGTTVAPTSSAIDRDHPGFNSAFRTAVDENAELLRAERRCLLRLPADVASVNFTAIQTFSRTSASSAALTDVSIETDPPDLDEYSKCIKSSMMSSNVSIQLPDPDMQDDFQVKDESRWSLNQNLTMENVGAAINELNERLAATEIAAPLHATIQLQIDYFNCLKSRGLTHRRDCLAE
jgi:hypothetical protein